MNKEEALKITNAYAAGDYDVAVVGAGHAGCEAAHACAVMGLKTILFTLHLIPLLTFRATPVSEARPRVRS